ncbi:epoxide hydrolase family protein [uncultured Bradyrhizobium sp.]|uniref:epoxide hydrolase family protein n=1 Tax=Bradyrhizobium sp. TaxID=376 RepID=UPI00261EACE2|nr:epoxide hydrolase family protein [uncultured Bradyrhizobium sp.]
MSDSDIDTILSRRGALLGAAAIAAGSMAAVSSSNALATPAPPSLPPATSEVSPFIARIPQVQLDDLKRRLAATRWPDREQVSDWSQGVPLERLRSLVTYWEKQYDWRRGERQLNSFPQFRTNIDGLGIHFLHVRSKHENALPIILTHGWPGSIFEFLKVIGPLTNPTAYGGKAEDAFHVVIPSLPGFGFSDKPIEKGWNLPRIARAWATLMKRLGYDRWVAQGGDWGAGVTTWLAQQRAVGLAAVHLNLPIMFPPPVEGTPNSEEKESIAQLIAFDKTLSGYAKIQATRPQTLGYALTDSPVGQAAWIYEKFGDWTDSKHDPESVLTREEMLNNISLYWLTSTATSSARLYSESFYTDFSTQKLDLPVAVSVFPGELYRPLKPWAERIYPQLYYWNEVSKGGHFAAFEQPGIFVAELRQAFHKLR